MAYRIDLTAECWDELDARWEWFRDHVSQAYAAKFYDAALIAAGELAEMPEGRPLCRDQFVQGLRLREQYFGVGRDNTHRLIFGVSGGSVTIFTVRSFAQDDLTPADL